MKSNWNTALGELTVLQISYSRRRGTGRTLMPLPLEELKARVHKMWQWLNRILLYVGGRRTRS